MKRSMLALVFIFSLSAHADLEHKPGQGEMPLRQKLSVSHGCFNEIDTIGCGHPRDDQEFFIGCLQDHKDELTPSCQTFFERLYGNKKST
jgi:hypothetical protein